MKSRQLECTVSSNSVALILLISRVFGTAPLQIDHHHTAWVISLSSMQTVYSYILMITLSVVMLACLVRDLNEDADESIRTRTPMTRVTWIVEVVISLCISVIEMSTAKNRFKQMIRCFNEIDKVIPKNENKSTEYKECGLIVFSLIYLFTMICLDFWYILNQSFSNDRDWTITVMYSAHYGMYLIIFTLELQFVAVVLLVRSSLKSLNDNLRRLLLDTKNQKKLKHQNLFQPRISVNIAIDTIAFDGIYPKFTATSTAHKTLRHLSLAHSTICKVIREINTSYGLVLLLVLFAIPMHLVVTLYYFLNCVLNRVYTHTLMLLLGWSILHTVNLLIIVEPCHRTKEEMPRIRVRKTEDKEMKQEKSWENMDQMRALVCQLMRVRGSTCNQLSHELKIFSKQIVLNNPQYSALGLFILDRQFVATIVGGLTTYLVIIIQFEHFSAKNVVY